MAYFTVNPSLDGGITYNAADGGSYTVDYELLEAEEDPAVPVSNFLTYNTDIITLTATTASGYNFKGWKKDGAVVSYANPWQTSFDAAATIEPVYETGQPNFKVDGITFEALNEAITFAQSEACTTPIVVVNQNCTLPAGDYTIPSGVILLVPFDAAYTLETTVPVYENNDNAVKTRTLFRQLTLASGVNITVYGSLSVGANLHARNGGQMTACVLDNYGRLHMEGESNIVINGNLYCWGFITGSGSINAMSNSRVYEPFQMDFRGGTHCSNTYKEAFPMCQYFVQNIEVPITFHYGAAETLVTCCYANYSLWDGIASFIGDNGLFRLESGSTLTRHYDGASDRQCYDLYGNASIQDISVSISVMKMASKDYILPINNNMILTIHSGKTTIYYDLALLPDSRVVIEEGATVEVKKNLYIYDKSDWRADETGYTYVDSNDKTQKSYFALGADLNSVPFSPTKTGSRKSANLSDAHIVVNGTLTTLESAGLYTTTHGADISSTGVGKIVLGKNTTIVTSFKQGISTASLVKDIPVTPAQLHNADGTYTPTANNNLTNTFEYQDGKWLAIVPENTAVEDGKELVVNYEEQLEAIDTLQISNGGTVTVSTDIEKPVVVENGGTVNVAEDTELSSLALNACPADINNGENSITAGQSSQVTGSGTIDANSNIYLDIKMHPSGNMNYLLWYTFAVPFNVAIEDGVEKVDKNGNATTAVLDTDYRCFTYDGSKRAEGNLAESWVQVTNTTDEGYFVPGKFYLVEFNSNAYNTFRFHKASGVQVNNAQNIELAVNASQTGDDKDGGWNAIANTALQDAKITISGGALVAQIYNPVNRKFESIVLSETTLALGAAMFVQVDKEAVSPSANNSVVSTPSPVVARRAQTNENIETYGIYQLRIGQPESAFDDQLIFSATTQEKQGYKAGKDLTKMFMGNSAVAQMWINDYNAKLTLNEMPMTDGKANASMTIYAPSYGEYELRLKSVPEDVTIYLTKDGRVIWNLCMADYTGTLNQGENTGYGIRIVSKAPQVTTGIDEAIVDTEENDIRKVFVEGQVYIIRGEKAYTVDGKNVK